MRTFLVVNKLGANWYEFLEIFHKHFDGSCMILETVFAKIRTMKVGSLYHRTIRVLFKAEVLSDATGDEGSTLNLIAGTVSIQLGEQYPKYPFSCHSYELPKTQGNVTTWEGICDRYFSSEEITQMEHLDFLIITLDLHLVYASHVEDFSYGADCDSFKLQTFNQPRFAVKTGRLTPSPNIRKHRISLEWSIANLSKVLEAPAGWLQGVDLLQGPQQDNRW